MSYDKRKMQDISLSDNNTYMTYKEYTQLNNYNFNEIKNLLKTDFKYKVLTGYNWNRLIFSINDRISLEEVPDWDSSKEYKAYIDIVSDSDNEYLCIKDIYTAGVPITDTTYWKKLEPNHEHTESIATTDCIVGAWERDFNAIVESSENFIFRGSWDHTENYSKNNLVRYRDEGTTGDFYNSYYSLIDDNIVLHPITFPDAWLPAQGIKGYKGFYVNATEPPSGLLADGDIWLQTDEEDIDYFYCTSLSDNNTIRFVAVGSFSTDTPALEISLDKIHWIPYSINSSIAMNNNGKCYFRGINDSFSIDRDNYINFSSTGPVDIAGDFLTLYDYTNLNKQPTKYCFYKLFANTKIRNADKLIFSHNAAPTSLSQGNYWYMSMFEGSSIVKALFHLENTIFGFVNDYRFYRFMTNCTELEQMPILSAEAYAFYGEAFSGCTSLQETTPLDFAVGCSCEWMFYGCTNLIKVNTTRELASYKYLHITQGKNYEGMFGNCSSLKNIPALYILLPANRDLLRIMFQNCSSLDKIILLNPKDTWGEETWSTSWVDGVAENGTFICYDTLPQTRGIDYIPQNWAIQTLQQEELNG